jgi:hypothetical protein
MRFIFSNLTSIVAAIIVFFACWSFSLICNAHKPNTGKLRVIVNGRIVDVNQGEVSPKFLKD